MSKKLLFSKDFHRRLRACLPNSCDKDEKRCAPTVLQKHLLLLKWSLCNSLLSKCCTGEKLHSFFAGRSVCVCMLMCVCTRGHCYHFPYIFNKFKPPSHDWQKRSQKSYFKLKRRQPFTTIFLAKI